MPFLPYGRQDKRISNDTTFALKTFADVINGMRFDSVRTLDVHSDIAEKLFDSFSNTHPTNEISRARREIARLKQGEIEQYNSLVNAFPDAGAKKRYSRSANDIIGHKVRDQATGYITEYKIEGEPEGKDILIVDDICDGGMTFKLMAKELYKQGAKSVHLYVTHGIFSKGVKTLKDDGIRRIFTREGEIFASKNTNYLVKEI